jgi:homoserine O-acetyltransferase
MNEVARRTLMSDTGFPSGPYGAGFEAWAALTRVIINREPGALNGVAAGAVPALVDQAIAAARSVGTDPLDWIYQSWAYDAHDVGTTPDFWRRHGSCASNHLGVDPASGSQAGSL